MGQIPRLQANIQNIHLFGYLGGGSVVSAQWWCLDVAGLCSSWVWDGRERMKGWYRLAHEEAQGCETAVTVPSGIGQSPQDVCVQLFTSAVL